MIWRLARVTMLLTAAVLAVTLVGHCAIEGPLRRYLEDEPREEQLLAGSDAEEHHIIYEAAGKGYKVSVTNESASGKTQYGYTTNADGTDAKLTGNNPNADTIAVRRIDANTLESVNKMGGKTTITQRNVLSADGKSRTVTTTGTDPKGQKVHNVAVFERQ